MGKKIVTTQKIKPVKLRLITAFDREASELLEENSGKAKINPDEFVKIHKGIGVGIKTFATEGELKAYVQGIEDGNGWDKPNYLQVS